MGLGGWLVVSVVVAFVLARMFAPAKLSAELDFDAWASKPLTRATGETARGRVPTREAASSPRPR